MTTMSKKLDPETMDEQLTRMLKEDLLVNRENDPPPNEDEYPFSLFEPLSCECGAEAAGSSGHSSWCPKFENN